MLRNPNLLLPREIQHIRVRRFLVISAVFEFPDGNYLGYRIDGHRVSIRPSSVDRYIQSVAALFTRQLRGSAAFRVRHSWLSADAVRQVFLEDLNERITGARDENRRYGWLFYFQEITDVEMLHKLDAIIVGFFSRLPEYTTGPPAGLKKLSRAHYAIRYDQNGRYIHNYNRFDTLTKKVEYLSKRGHLHPEVRHTAQQIDEIFGRVKQKHLSTLDADVGLTS